MKPTTEYTRSEPVETILCSAIHFDDGRAHAHQPINVPTGVVLCGYRHCSIFGQTATLFLERKKLGTLREEQGFLTSLNRFVGRKEAGAIAHAAGQIDKPTDMLFSEDLW